MREASVPVTVGASGRDGGVRVVDFDELYRALQHRAAVLA